ncbi:MAG: PucR family transcriptional regulator [Lachnospiraceae bacterium]
MPITLQQLCEQSNYLYGMRVLAGERSMKNIVQWVHTIEDEEASSFLHGGELIFTTGIAHKETKWLFSFIRRLQKQDVSGIVINYGPYIEKVPRDVIEYCESSGFPLLEVPWKTKLVDITRDFCNQIIQAEQEELEIAQAFRNMIAYPYVMEPQIEYLEKRQFGERDTYCLLGVFFSYLDEKNVRENTLRIALFFTKILQLSDEKCKYSYSLEKEPFTHIVIILKDYTSDEITNIVDRLQSFGDTSGYFSSFYIGVSENARGIQKIPQNYNKVVLVQKLAKSKQRTPLYYEDFGVEKLLLSIPERETMESYYHSVLGKLVNFDRKNDTEYVKLLSKYVEFDGSVQKVADDSGVHRNTVNYQLGKIRKILGNELYSWNDKFQIMLAFQIREIL